jgi:hypothetical protein
VVASKAVVESNRFGGLLEASKRELHGQDHLARSPTLRDTSFQHKLT